jgi:hypothetical protein
VLRDLDQPQYLGRKGRILWGRELINLCRVLVSVVTVLGIDFGVVTGLKMFVHSKLGHVLVRKIPTQNQVWEEVQREPSCLKTIASRMTSIMILGIKTNRQTDISKDQSAPVTRPIPQ